MVIQGNSDEVYMDYNLLPYLIFTNETAHESQGFSRMEALKTM